MTGALVRKVYDADTRPPQNPDPEYTRAYTVLVFDREKVTGKVMAEGHPAVVCGSPIVE
jgi:hypothetical protein